MAIYSLHTGKKLSQIDIFNRLLNSDFVYVSGKVTFMSPFVRLNFRNVLTLLFLKKKSKSC